MIFCQEDTHKSLICRHLVLNDGDGKTTQFQKQTLRKQKALDSQIDDLRKRSYFILNVIQIVLRMSLKYV